MKTYIKERAKERGISLTDIFNELGLKSYPSFLRTLENSDNLKLKQLQIIASKIGCTIDEPGTCSDQSMIVSPHCGKSINLKCEKA